MHQQQTHTKKNVKESPSGIRKTEPDVNTDLHKVQRRTEMANT